MQNEQSHQLLLPLDRFEQFDMYRQSDIKLAKGDAIRITRNGFATNKKRLNNGQILEVVAIDQHGTVRLRNRVSQVKYTLPNSFGHLAYAHCLTSHAAQGQTVDQVFIAQPAAAFAATNLNQFYVSVSRARDGVHIYTDDKAALLANASELGDRLSALELVQHKKTSSNTAEHLVRTKPPITTPVKTKREPKPVIKPVQRKPNPHAPRP